MSPTRPVWILALALLTHPVAQAEDERAAPPPSLTPRPWGPERVLTLDEAYSLARSQSPDMITLMSRIDQAGAMKIRVAAALQPMINGSLYYNRNSDEAVLSFGGLVDVAAAYTDYQFQTHGMAPTPLPDDPNNPAYGLTEAFAALDEEIVIQPINQYGAQISVVWGLINPRTGFLAKQILKGYEATTEGMEWGQRLLLFGVAQLYYGLYAMQESVEVVQRQLESRQSHLATVEARFAAGQVSQTEVVRAQVEVVQAQRQVRELSDQAHSLAADFAVMLGLNGVELKVSEPPHPTGEVPALTDEEVKDILDTRPDVRSARAQVASSHAGLSDSKAAFFPTVALTGTGRWSNSGGFTGQNTSWVVGAGANIPIWDGGMRVADLKEAQQRLVQAEANLHKVEMTARKELQVAQTAVERGHLSVAAAEEELRLAKRTAEQITALFEAGQVTTLELRDAELLLQSSEFNLVRQRLELDQAGLKLEQAMGRFDPGGS